MEPQVGDVITQRKSDRIRTVLRVSGLSIQYHWRDQDGYSGTTQCTLSDLYDNPQYKITRSKQYLISKFNEVWKNS